jgi:hypothetical protein
MHAYSNNRRLNANPGKKLNAAEVRKALFLPRSDAEFTLEPLAAALLAAGVPKKKAQSALSTAARRSLRLAASDSGLPMKFAKKAAGDVARRLVRAA